jgi:hypothetical protein
MRIANVPNEFDDVHHHVSFQESGHRYIYKHIKKIVSTTPKGVAQTIKLNFALLANITRK